MSLVLCFSNLISSLRAWSFNFNFKSSSFFLFFCISIFFNLSFSNCSILNLLFSSFLRILYFAIESEILSKNTWIYFSSLEYRFILKFGFIDNWNFTILYIKLSTLFFFIFLLFLRFISFKNFFFRFLVSLLRELFFNFNFLAFIFLKFLNFFFFSFF